MTPPTTTVTWYVARNHHGEYCRGKSWVSDLDDARLYRRIGPAKTAVTKRARVHPTEPAAHILEWKLDIATATVIDMADKTAKTVARIEKRKAAKLEAYKERRRADLERELARKTEELRTLSQ